jgi:hypothetical protein
MQQTSTIIRQRIGLLGLALLFFFGSASPTQAQIELESGDWSFSVSGNVNAHYVFTVCDDSPGQVDGSALLCTGDNKNSVQNGLLPAALVAGVSTTQNGIDINGTFGFYPGTVSNTNAGLGTPLIDMRQVFVTFGNERMGTFKLGRDFGLFAFDPIINDISLVGVGPTASVANPLNTSLGGIGYGYFYTDALSQINYTTPSFSGFTATAGVFQPLNLGSLGTSTITGESGSDLPGIHGKLNYAFDGNATGFFSVTAITQSVEALGTGPNGNPVLADYQAFGTDATFNINVGGFGFLGYGYYASGMGTTILFYEAVDAFGNERDSYGGLAQLSYTFGDTRVGVNGGLSILDETDAESGPANTNLNQQLRLTGGVYHALTPNLQLVFETSYFEAQSHADGVIDNLGFNAGVFFAF